MTPSDELTLEERIEALEASFRNRPAQLVAPAKVCLVVFSGDLDKLLAALTIATGAASMGTEVSLFFTFWATAALRGESESSGDRTVMDRMFARLLPRGTTALKLSRMHMGGLGTALINRRMRDKRLAGCDELLEMARDLGVSIRVCDMSMDLMGIRRDDLIDFPGLEPCGVAAFMEGALESAVTLFV